MSAMLEIDPDPDADSTETRVVNSITLNFGTQADAVTLRFETDAGDVRAHIDYERGRHVGDALQTAADMLPPLENNPLMEASDGE